MARFDNDEIALFDTVKEGKSDELEQEVKEFNSFKEYLKAKKDGKLKALFDTGKKEDDYKKRKYSEKDSLGVSFFKMIANNKYIKALDKKLGYQVDKPEPEKSLAEQLAEQQKDAQKVIADATKKQYTERINKLNKTLKKDMDEIDQITDETEKAKKKLMAQAKYNKEKEKLEAQFKIDYQYNSGAIDEKERDKQHKKLLAKYERQNSVALDYEDDDDETPKTTKSSSSKPKSRQDDEQESDQDKIEKQQEQDFRETQTEYFNKSNEITNAFVEQQTLTNEHLDKIIEGLEKGNFKIVVPINPNQGSGGSILENLSKGPKSLVRSAGSMLSKAARVGPWAALAYGAFNGIKEGTNTEAIAEREGVDPNNVSLMQRFQHGMLGGVASLANLPSKALGFIGADNLSKTLAVSKDDVLDRVEQLQNGITGNGFITNKEQENKQRLEDLYERARVKQQSLLETQQGSSQTQYNQESEGTELAPLNTAQPESMVASQPMVVTNNNTTVVPEQPRFRLQDSSSYQLSRIGE